jgi:3-hexulose-6-phosphate synthase/6-phospho-3-hexuloisomerase
MDTQQAVASEHFKRSSAADIRRTLETVSTPNISDGAHRQPCLPGMKALLQGARAVGPAVTVRTMPGDWAKPVEAIDVTQEGDVIVIDACGQPPAIWGELASESATNKKLAGVVVHGAVRDTPEIRRLGLPVWSTHVTSHAGDPHGHGSINEPIEIGGQTISPGDWIVADDDGVMAIPKGRAVEMANRAADVLEAENRIRAEIRDGESTLAQVVNLERWEKQGAKGAIG